MRVEEGRENEAPAGWNSGEMDDLGNLGRSGLRMRATITKEDRNWRGGLASKSSACCDGERIHGQQRCCGGIGFGGISTPQLEDAYLDNTNDGCLPVILRRVTQADIRIREDSGTQREGST
ncbi:hypothetical protein CMUS01_01734 [Colletotrichum musicola]|uniref:Uncharacterized protein n=1 Tax=Colletotrichum musicola TaxID=2175873 RepID=A0A8H6NWM0_9PEZI|nr:hypothetical protein CMUS01_01734 [Colletotrichum musicola]